MLVVPIEESILYVQPIYISARQEGTGVSTDISALPEFKRVVVVFGDRIVMRDSLAAALAAVFGEAPPAVVEDPDASDTPPDTGELPDEVAEAVAALLTQADDAFARADEALRNGDLGTYADEVAEAQSLIEQARSLLEGG
jgi:uncharacterized membrane protein (UPF0182 family)